jgi:hypothetical protein
MTDYSNEAIDVTIERLTAYSERLHQTATQAKVLYACFQSLNENKELRERIAKTPAASASNILMHAALRELMMILVRVFDRPGRWGIEKSDKVTFPIIAEWLKREPIREALLQRARNWLDDGYLAERHEASAKAAMDDLQTRLDCLQAEQPNRQQLLRDFRDGFLAHELERQIPRDPPLFGHIGEMLEEVRLLSEAASLAIRGTEIAWEPLDDQIARSANWLWQRVGEIA